MTGNKEHLGSMLRIYAHHVVNGSRALRASAANQRDPVANCCVSLLLNTFVDVAKKGPYMTAQVLGGNVQEARATHIA